MSRNLRALKLRCLSFNLQKTDRVKLFSEEKWKQTVAPKHIFYHTISSHQYRNQQPVGSPSKKPVINDAFTKQKITYS